MPTFRDWNSQPTKLWVSSIYYGGRDRSWIKEVVNLMLPCAEVL